MNDKHILLVEDDETLQALIEKFLVNNGDRIAQMVLMPVLKFEFEETKDLPDTLRGSGGFGSTGKK